MKIPPVVNDARRQQYLREAGIPLFWPRRPLPGAGPSRRYRHASVTAPSSGNPVEEELMPSVPVPAAADLAGLRQRLQKSPTEIGVEAGPETTTAPGPPVAAAASAPEKLAFRFSCFRPDDRLIVLAGHEEPQLPTGSRRLLQRILAALNSRYGDVSLRAEPFQWPLDPSMPADLEAARQVVGAFLRRRCAAPAPQYMLALMDEPPVWLFSADCAELADREAEPVQHPGLGLQVIRIPSLGTMERNSAVKRPAWEAMKPLVGPLSGRAGE